MRWSIKIARVAGIDVKIHITFILFLLWIWIMYYKVGGVEVATDGVILVLALFGCVLLHEFGHALAGRAFGINTPDITLLPIGGVARMLKMPDKPWQELIVALAGPSVNIIIAGFLIFVLGHTASIGDIENLDNPKYGLLPKLASVNIVLALFNMIPAFPMDGGRVLRALLAMAINYRKATQIAAGIGQALAFVFALIGLFWNPMLIFIALFVYLGAAQEVTIAQMKEITPDVSVSEAMMTHLLTLKEDSTLDDAIDALLKTSQHEFPVLDNDGFVLGVLTRDDMISALKNNQSNAPVVEFMRRDLPLLSLYDPLEEAYRKMQECSCPALPVVDDTGRFVGLITPENVGEFFMVRSLRPHRRHLPENL